MATGSAGGLAAPSGRPAGTTPLHDFNRENLPERQEVLGGHPAARHADTRVRAAPYGLVDGDQRNVGRPWVQVIRAQRQRYHDHAVRPVPRRQHGGQATRPVTGDVRVGDAIRRLHGGLPARFLGWNRLHVRIHSSSPRPLSPSRHNCPASHLAGWLHEQPGPGHRDPWAPANLRGVALRLRLHPAGRILLEGLTNGIACWAEPERESMGRA
jgi:hypothetical protein